MRDAFGYVIFGVAILGGVVGVISLIGRDRLYDQIGRGGLSIGEENPPGAPGAEPGGAPDAHERDAEIRQMLTARNARRAARGEPERDIDSELADLTRPAVDATLLAEIRELVVARNARRVARGEPPLDVDSEVERQVRDLAG